MTVKMPGAVWRPLSRNFTARKRTRTDCVILHVAVSEGTSLYGWFNNPAAGASSHLYVDYDGRMEQYLDLDHISWANGEGNARSITVETAGLGSGTWTGPQIAALVRIVQFAHQHYGVPLQLMPDSRSTTKGIGYHRLGCDPWRHPQGERWSRAYGKICPGPDRIPQIPGIIAAAAGGGTIRPAATTTTPAPSNLLEVIMSMTRAEATKLLDERLAKNNDAMYDKLKTGLQWCIVDEAGNTLRTKLHSAERGAQGAYSNSIQINALAEAVRTLANAEGLDPDDVLAAVTAAVKGALPDAATVVVPLNKEA